VSAAGGLRLAAVAAVALAACGGGGGGPTGSTQQQQVPTPLPVSGVRAQGNTLVDAAGTRLRLRGVNHSGSEYACIQGWGLFDGAVDAAAANAIASWKANVVRVPLNISSYDGTPTAYGQTFKARLGS